MNDFIRFFFLQCRSQLNESLEEYGRETVGVHVEERSTVRGKCEEEDGEVKERTLIGRTAERGAQATGWRAGPCVNGDVLNLC